MSHRRQPGVQDVKELALTEKLQLGGRIGCFLALFSPEHPDTGELLVRDSEEPYLTGRGEALAHAPNMHLGVLD